MKHPSDTPPTKRTVSPVAPSENGIKIRPELMENEKLYYCIFGEKLMLVYKDDQEVLNCYEVQEEELVNQVKACQDSVQIDTIIEEFIKKNNLNN